MLDAAEKYGAATLAAPVKNTIKESDENGFIVNTPDRSKLWEVYTPQVFRVPLIQQGFALAQERQITVTDDNALVELIPHPIKLISGSTSNIKITTPEDWTLAQVYRTPEDFVNLDSARQSQIEASRSERRSPALSGQGEEEDRFGKVAASPDSQNLPVGGV